MSGFRPRVKMKNILFLFLGVFIFAITGSPLDSVRAGESFHRSMEIFPLVAEHAHGSTIVELENGDLLAAWFQGSGERWADDVAIKGARLRKGEDTWSEPFVMADVPDFPDCNPVLFIDHNKKLWLVWYTVIANQWETSLPKYRISENYQQVEGAPEWAWQDDILFKPGDPSERGILPNDRFVKSVERKLKEYGEYLTESVPNKELTPEKSARWQRWSQNALGKARGEDMKRKGYYIDENGQRVNGQMGYPYFQRMGWQSKNKAVLLDNNRIVIPFYSDGFGFSLMAITDDGGQHWTFSEPLVAPGCIQPSIAKKADGTLVAYMRDNGPPPKRLHVSESPDNGITWRGVRDSQLPNPGSGADVVTLRNGHWVLAYNDGKIGNGRRNLAVSISTNEGESWDYTSHLEIENRKDGVLVQGSYPSIIEGKDGTIHIIYSYHFKDKSRGEPNETIKYARINEAWVLAGDSD